MQNASYFALQKPDRSRILLTSLQYSWISGRIHCMTTPLEFIKQTQEELVKVVWPTRQEVIRLTGVVIGVSLLVGLFIGGLDYLFTTILTRVVR